MPISPYPKTSRRKKPPVEVVIETKTGWSTPWQPIMRPETVAVDPAKNTGAGLFFKGRFFISGLELARSKTGSVQMNLPPSARITHIMRDPRNDGVMVEYEIP